MGKGINRFSATAVKALREPGWHADGGGLYIWVRNTGGRSFVYVCTKGGRRRDLTIGPLEEWTLAEAREQRDRLRRGEPLKETIALRVLCRDEWRQFGTDPRSNERDEMCVDQSLRRLKLHEIAERIVELALLRMSGVIEYREDEQIAGLRLSQGRVERCMGRPKKIRLAG